MEKKLTYPVNKVKLRKVAIDPVQDVQSSVRTKLRDTGC